MKRIGSLCLLVCAAAALHAQNDGDHTITNPGGQTFMATDGIATSTPVNLTVGTTPNVNATLNVRGDQLPVNDAFGTSRCTFRTDGAAQFNQNWSMVRDGTQIGRLWHGNPQFPFHVQSTAPPDYVNNFGSGLYLQNDEGDGIKIIHNGPLFSGNTLNGYTINRQGYAALGSRSMWTGFQPNGPWSRLHLTHENVGANAPFFGFRIWMRNGLLATGNSDLCYVGHLYDTEPGSGNETDDNGNMVAAWGDDELPAGPHNWDNFTFRYVGSLGALGSAGTDNGLEIMRLRPYHRDPNDRIEGFVGIGDWENTGTLPEERLDVLNGRVRIRQLPTDLEMTGATKAMVVDATGVVGWRTFPTGGGTDCRWALNNVNNLITATTWSGLCVAQDKLVLYRYRFSRGEVACESCTYSDRLVQGVQC